ncbi:MAG: VCBS repeat-containing protein [Gemmataceae bacterium]
MTSRSWIRKLFARPVTRPIRKAAAAPRLRVEPLEDRCVPDASVTGTAAADHFHVRPGTVAGTVIVSSDNGTFAPQTLVNLTGTLNLLPGTGEDTITIEPLGGRFTGNVSVTDPDTVTLKNMALPGSLTVSAVRITAADGANIQAADGDITLAVRDTANADFPLNNPLFRDRQAAAGITIGSATLTGRNVTLTSSASTTKLARTNVSQDTRAVALADVNGDGRPDLITAATDPGTGGGLGGPLLLFLNTGRVDPFDGSIPQTITRGGGMTSLAVGDVTGDGKPDLVVGSTANPDLQGTFRFSRLFVNTGRSAAPFEDAPGSVFNVGTGRDYTTSVALADVNGDRKLDLLLGNEVGIPSGQIGFSFPTASRLILNQGGANPFSAEGRTVGALSANTQAVAFADLNGDGRMDLIAANAPYADGLLPITEVPSTSRVFLNTGGSVPFDGFGTAFGGDGTLPVTSVATGDLNGDGRPDIVLGVNGRPSQVFLSAAGTPAYLAAPITLGGADAVKGVVLTDVNKDGHLDIVTAVAGVSRVYVNQGTGSAYTRYDLVSDGFTSNGVAAAAAADLNGDGRPDLAVVGKDAPPQVFVNNGAARPYTEATLKTVSLDPSLTTNIDAPFLGTKSLFASAVVSKADSSVLVNGGASLTATAGDVVIDSWAVAAASNLTVGVFVGVTYADVEPTATARLLPGARVSAAGAFQLLARTNTALDVGVTTIAPMLVNIDIAYGKSRSAATATVGAGAAVTAGSATVAANAHNSLNTSAGGFNLTFGNKVVSGGVGIAVTDYSSKAVAQMDGTLTTTTGDALVAANATNAANSTEASASVLSVTRTLIGAGKSVQGVGESVKKLAPLTAPLSGVLQGGGYLLGMLAGGSAKFAAAAGIAWVTSELTATAGVGGRVTVPRHLVINSRTEDNVKVVATGSAGNADTASLGGGLAVSNLTNTASSTVAPGADLAVGGQLHVTSNAVVPNPLSASLPGDFRFVPPPDTTGTPTSNDADRVANAYQMGQATADGFLTYMGSTVVPIVTGILFGNPRALGTSFVKGTGTAEEGQPGNSVGIGGGINVFRLNNTSTATIGQGAKVNQRSPGPDVPLAEQDVWVEADTTVITIHLGNQIAASNAPDGGAGAAGAAAVGGQFEYVGYINKAIAHIDDGAQVKAGRDLRVTANTFNYLMTVIQAGAKAKSVGVGGTLSIHELRNQTQAYVEDGATLEAGRDLQVLAGNQLQVFNAGGGITQGSNAGFGVSAVANLLQQNDTLAFLGDNNGLPQAGSVTAGRNVDVKATADTLVVGVALSGAAADGRPDKLEEPGGPDTFSTFKEWGAARLAYLKSLNPKGGIGVAGDVVVNGLVSDTRAFIRGPGSVTAGRDLTVAARDTSLFAAASGAVAVGNSAGFAGSVAVNTVKRTTRAFADGATRLTAGNLAVTAVSIETPVTVTVGAGVAKEDAAVAGSVSVTAVDSTTAADLATTGGVTTTRPSTLFDRAGVTVDAYHSSATYSVAGVAAAAVAGTAAVGLAADIAVMTGEGAKANLGGQVTSAGDVKVYATDSQTLFGVAAGLAAALKDGAGAAGSASVGSVKQTAIASVARNAHVEATSSVRVDADGRLYDLRVAGGVAGGKNAGVGGAATVNLVPNRTVRAVIDDFARVRASGANGLVLEDPQGVLGSGTAGVAVNAGTADTLLLFAAAGALSPGTLALAGTVTVNLMTNNTTDARTGAGTEVGPGDNAYPLQNVLVTAGHQTNAVTVAGSLAAAKTAGVGAAGVIETIDRDVKALVGPSSAVTAKGW